MQVYLRHRLAQLDALINASPLAGTWQRFKWLFKYRLGRPGHVPDFETLLNRPHRPILLERLDSLGAWHSVLEVGCGRGVNLMLLAKRNPGATLVGLDASTVAIRDARSTLARHGIEDIRFSVGVATSLSDLSDKSMDVVFADALLMYIPPKSIVESLSEMLRVARFGILASAWHEDLPLSGKPWRYDEGTWVYDFHRVGHELLGVSFEVTPYPEGVWEDARWRKYGAILRVVTHQSAMDPA